MPKTQQDFLEEARREIPEVSVEEVEARRKRGDDLILLDVREKDEVRAGYIEGAVTIPRGFLEFQAAGHIPNTDKDVVVYCAGGARSLLAAIGTLGIVDADVVDLSNLQRQILHSTDRIGVPKTESAKQMINALNPDVQIRLHNERLTVDNVMAIFQDYDIIVDGCDNFPTRYLVNDAAFFAGKPVVHGSIFQFEGQASVFKPHAGPCYRCLFPTPPPPGMVPS